ncbi:1,6-anhydro-N-acetylmuramyl-L-alanine amidase AmpD [Celerinatantimonas yamalensis]|uniref:1,6-anhydro-N-acetylmuramyl-L-alanine amidase AmpD n=1 Tax=Celerinatantimonas yamalensis TaxID=559956 RepID=A0ABW9G5M1_9GAMM
MAEVSMVSLRIDQTQLDHWLNSGLRYPSCYFNERPDPGDISLLVIHCISLPQGCYRNQMVQQFFCGQLNTAIHPELHALTGLEVSAHLLIDRCGQYHQFVPFNRRAWHAGVSQFNGRENCNDFSIGIELEGIDSGAFTRAQYTALVAVTSVLLASYPKITQQRIAAHSEIAPGRKSDPGCGFDWDEYRQLLDSYVGQL